MAKKTEKNDVTAEALKALLGIYTKVLSVQVSSGMSQGLVNLSGLVEFDLEQGLPKPVPGHGEVKLGVIGFRRASGQMSLAAACDTATVQYFPLEKVIAMIEGMHDERRANVVTQNHKVGDEGRGQIVARINPVHSAFHVVQGVIGRVIKEPKDIVRSDVYYFDRQKLTSYYLAAKEQISTEDQLDDMIAAYDGWKGYSIPIDPLNPEG